MSSDSGLGSRVYLLIKKSNFQKLLEPTILETGFPSILFFK